MATKLSRTLRRTSWLLWALCLSCTGCYSFQTCTYQPDPCLCECRIPRELDMVSLPAYVIEPPDILLIDAVRTIPLPPYRIQPLDILAIQVTGALATEPIAGLYTVDPDGTVGLGFNYGSVRVAGMSIAGTGTVWLYNGVPACRVLPWRGSKEVRATADL